MKLLADIKDTFGTIKPPPALEKFIGQDTTGAAGISRFLSNFVVLIYSISAVVLVFMILWGAFDWMTSEGDKEKLASAQKKILNAFIGILLLAITFAILSVLGTFTSFRFFEGQGIKSANDPTGAFKYICPDGTRVGGNVGTFEEACGKHGY